MLLLPLLAPVLAFSGGQTDEQPNIFMLLTDDQDSLLGGADRMPILRHRIATHGANFTNAFVHTPICCPSRSSYLSGRYLQNSLTFQNGAADGCANASWAAGPEKRSFAVHLQNAGYVTSYAGKYLNHYGLAGGANCSGPKDPSCFRVPPGWSDWHGLQGNSRYYNGTVSDNGVPSEHGDSPLDDYLPDLFFNHTFRFLEAQVRRRASAEPFAKKRPFLAVLATPSCHGPFTPSPIYAGRFSGASAPRTPNWNASQESVDAKQWLIRQQSPLDDDDAAGIDLSHNMRLETLLSVDDYVGKVVDLLEGAGELANTFVLYTSDHGFQLGQHRLPGDKRHLYEHDIRVPFFVRGPGVPLNVSIAQPVLSIDVAPTLVHLGTGAVPDDMDGRSFLPLLVAAGGAAGADSGDAPEWRSDFLVKYYGAGSPPCGLQKCPPPASHFHENDAYNNTFACVRSLSAEDDSIYCEFSDDENFVEYYDHTADAWQLDNCAATAPPASIAHYKARLEQLRHCAGVECRS